LKFAGLSRDHHSKLWYIVGILQHPVKSIRDVYLGQENGNQAGVGLVQRWKNPPQRPTKPHGFGWGQRNGIQVDEEERIITDGSGSPITLGYLPKEPPRGRVSCWAHEGPSRQGVEPTGLCKSDPQIPHIKIPCAARPTGGILIGRPHASSGQSMAGFSFPRRLHVDVVDLRCGPHGAAAVPHPDADHRGHPIIA
jgi:hypothetical protein